MYCSQVATLGFNVLLSGNLFSFDLYILFTGNLALHYASWQGHDAPMRLLLRCGGAINFQNSSGSTPLHLAALQGHVNVVSVYALAICREFID